MFENIRGRLENLVDHLKHKLRSSFLIICGIIAGALISTCTSCNSRTSVVVENNAAGTYSEFSVSSPNEISFRINTVKEE